MTDVWTIDRVLRWTAERFGAAGLESARLDAEVLLAAALGTTRIGLYTSFDKPLGPEELARCRESVKRRLAREPVAYIVGEKEFWSLGLIVTPAVLIPRRETETLVEAALGIARARRPEGSPSAALRIADIGTGSGAVALALAREPTSQVTASDLSDAALEVARQNAARHGLEARVRFVRGDLVSPLDGPFDLIVSNPPYVPAAVVETLAPEVRREPLSALAGGDDGLAILRRLVAEAPSRLAPGGWLAVEHGHDQGEQVRDLFASVGLTDVTTRRDLASIERVTLGRAPC